MLNPEHKKSTDFCTYCPKMCHFSCPVAEAEKNEAYTPWGKQQTAKLIDAGELALNEENAEIAYRCVTCRASQSFCKHEISPSDALHDLREKAVAKEVAPVEVLAFKEIFRTHNNPYGRDLQKKLLQVINDRDGSIQPSRWLDPHKKRVYFAGCHTLGLNPAGVGDTLELLTKLKVEELGVFAEPLQSCGCSLWNLGFRTEFEELAQIQYQSLKKYSLIVVGTPECAWTLKEVYPQIKLKLKARISTISEYVAQHLRRKNFQSLPKSRPHYFYHDSCYMGRYLKQYDEPREMLKIVTGTEPMEFSCHHHEARCSGAGGGYPMIAPDHSLTIANWTAQEMLDQEVKTLVTACPKAAQQFKNLNKKLVVKELISFLNENIL